MLTAIFLLLLCIAPLIGSFLGVVILRNGSDTPFWRGRSVCERCGHALGSRDLVPLFSWLLLHRRCRYCAAKLRNFYPAVEVLAILPVLWSGLTMTGPLLVVSTCFGWALIVLGWIDARQQRLPDMFTLPLLLAGILVAYGFDADHLGDHIVGAILGFIVFFAISWLYRHIRKQNGLGLGDAKFLAALGGWLSWTALPSIILLAAIVAIGFVIATRHRGLMPTRKIPFGPFLAAAAWIVWLYGPLVPG